MLAHWNNSLRVDMSLHSDTLFWFRANQSLLLFLNAAYLAENKQLNYVHALYVRKFVEHLKIIYLHVYYMYPVCKFNVRCNQCLSLCTLCNVRCNQCLSLCTLCNVDMIISVYHCVHCIMLDVISVYHCVHCVMWIW